MTRLLVTRLGIALGFVLSLNAGGIALAQSCTVTCSATVPASAEVNTAVPFQATATPCGCAGTATYQWNFGDNSSSTEQNPSYTYSAAGTYTWSLTTSAEGVDCTRQGMIRIESGAAAPTAGTYEGTTSQGLLFQFVVNSSGQITSWTVSYSCPGFNSQGTTSSTCNITDGNFTCGTSSCIPFVSSTSIAGTFSSATSASGTVTIRHQPDVLASCCIRSNLTWSATLTPLPLAATASADTMSGNPPLNVNFAGSASGGSGTYTYNWDFGDCSPASTQQNPSYTYQSAGRFYAVLTVDDGSTTATAAPLTIQVGTPGDANGDGAVDVADVVYLLTHLFASGSPPVIDSDVNRDGSLTIADVFYLINYLFLGGPPPQ